MYVCMYVRVFNMLACVRVFIQLCPTFVYSFTRLVYASSLVFDFMYLCLSSLMKALYIIGIHLYVFVRNSIC